MIRPAGLRSRLREDGGTMTVLTLGVLVVILMVIGVGVAITGVQLARNELQSLADGASLAASQGFEESAVYAGATGIASADPGGEPGSDPGTTVGPGAGAVILPTAAQARRLAADYLAGAVVQDARLREVTVDDVRVEADGTVRITLAARVDPPLAGWFTRGTGTSIPLHAAGDARAR